HTHAHAHTHTYSHTHKHMHSHTHTHTHTHTPLDISHLCLCTQLPFCLPETETDHCVMFSNIILSLQWESPSRLASFYSCPSKALRTDSKTNSSSIRYTAVTFTSLSYEAIH